MPSTAKKVTKKLRSRAPARDPRGDIAVVDGSEPQMPLATYVSGNTLRVSP